MNKIESAARQGAMLALLATALLGTGARAQQAAREPTQPPAPEVDTEKEVYAKLPPCKLSDDGKHLAEEPCRTAKAREPVPRRAVPQAIERVPPAAGKAASPAPPSRVLPTPPRQPQTTPGTADSRPGAPIPTAGCDAGGCYGPGGQRYNNGPGATVVSPSGKLCSRNGAWIQC